MEILVFVAATIGLATALVNLTISVINIKKRKDHRSTKR